MAPILNIVAIASTIFLLTRPIASAPATCVSESQPNPIVAQYPDLITGTINGTTAIIPIPYEAARKIVPAQYGLLTKAAKSLIPSLLPGTFPAILEYVVDHDVQRSGFKIPDFQRASIKIPFVDRLNDGYSSFRYIPSILVTESFVNLSGDVFYGTLYRGNFEPPCNPYVSNKDGSKSGKAYLSPGSSQAGSKPAFDVTFRTASRIPYSIDVFQNLTNQPWFGDVVPLCDNFIVLFNSSVTTGKYAPVPVAGSVSVTTPFYIKNTTFPLVYGYRMDNAFIEINNVTCESLKGYAGTGPGD